MNTVARKLLHDARKVLKDEPDAVWPAAVVELAEMLQDREKELMALHEQIGTAERPQSVDCCVRKSQALMATRCKHL